MYENANTRLGDAHWWAVVTIATVGYGDYYPVTAVGRVIAVFVTLSGIGIFTLSRYSFAAKIATNKVKVKAED
jgi:voltage-gated potassium channel